MVYCQSRSQIRMSGMLRYQPNLRFTVDSSVLAKHFKRRRTRYVSEDIYKMDCLEIARILFSLYLHNSWRRKQ